MLVVGCSSFDWKCGPLKIILLNRLLNRDGGSLSIKREQYMLPLHDLLYRASSEAGREHSVPRLSFN